MKKGILKSMAVALLIFSAFTSNVWAKEIGTGTVKEGVLGYKNPAEGAEVVCYLNSGEALTIVEETDKYYGLLTVSNELVYVEKDYIEAQKNEVAEDSALNVQISQSSKGEAVVNYAKQFIGLPYRSGGNSLATGVDCSGFTQQVYANFNVSLQRSSRAQYASNGVFVRREELVPGDLVFYGNGSVNHVAIYIGNDQIIHAPVPGQSVCIVPISQRGDARIMGCKRIFN